MTLFAIAVFVFTSSFATTAPTNPVARWTEAPYLTRSTDFVLTLSAEHPAGIAQVEFRLNDGAVRVVREKAPHPTTGYREYLLPIDVDSLPDGLHEVRAVVRSLDGGVLELSGDPLSVGNLSVRNNGINSFFFRTGVQRTIRIGPTGEFPTIDSAFAALPDVRGTRLLLESGDHVGLSVDWGKLRQWGVSDQPVLIEGVDKSARMVGRFGFSRYTSFAFRNLTILCGKIPEGGGERFINGSNRGNNMLFFLGCLFVPDSADPLAWQQLGWRRSNDLGFFGGIFSIGNVYHKINKGPDAVTLSKHDVFKYLTWDCLSTNPGGVFDLWTDLQQSSCDDHGKHTDIIQYFRPHRLLDHGPVRNRLFCDVRATNFWAQPGNLTGSNEKDADGVLLHPSLFKDWVFARWTIDSQDRWAGLNFNTPSENVAFIDITFRNATLNLYNRLHPQQVAAGMTHANRGLFFRNVITNKWKALGTPEEISDGVVIENFWTEQYRPQDRFLTGSGPVDYARPSAPIGLPSDGTDGYCRTLAQSEQEILDQDGVLGCSLGDHRGHMYFYYDDEDLDLSNSVFAPESCYGARDLTRLLAAFGSAGTKWDLDGDGEVSGRDLGRLLESMCTDGSG